MYNLFVNIETGCAREAGGDGTGGRGRVGVCHAGQLRSSHLRRHGSLALQLVLVALERLLPAVFQVRACVVFWQAMLGAHERQYGTRH